MTATEARTNSQAIVSKLLNFPLFLAANNFAAFMPMPHEVDIKPILQIDKPCYLPVVQSARQLSFARVLANTKLTKNKFNILEPDSTSFLPANNLDLVLCPLIGFDKAGRRLGNGGGFYDTTFVIGKQTSTTPKLIGIGYEKQLLESFPHDSWDVKLYAVITDKKIHIF